MDAFAKLQKLAQQASAADIMTIVSGPAERENVLGKMLVIPHGQEPDGQLLDPVFTAKLLAFRDAHEWIKPQVFQVEYHGNYQCFWDRLAMKPRALILGAGHISQPLAELLAVVDYEVVIADDRPDFANALRFPQAAQVICQSFEKLMLQLPLAEFSAIVIVTRGHRYDLDCLRVALLQASGYIGMIGSKRRVASILTLLQEEGISRERLSRLHAPIGLDIGAQSPAEIAVSIVAELIAFMRGGKHLPLSEQWRSCHGS